MAKRKSKSPKVSGELTEGSGSYDAAQETKKHDELLAQVKHQFLADLRAQSAWEAEAKECGQFYDGHQWTEDEKRVLKERGQPDVTINRMGNRVDAIVGIQMQTRVDTKAFARGDRENEVLVLSEKLRDIERDSDFDSEETDAFKDLIIEGRGWYECVKSWDGLKSTRLVRRRENTDIVKDRHGRRVDMSDWRRVHDTVMTNIEDGVAMFPEYEEKLEAALEMESLYGPVAVGTTATQVRPDQYKSGETIASDGFTHGDYSEFCNKKSRQIRITKTFYRTKVRRTFMYAAGTDPIEVTHDSDKRVKEFQEMFPGAYAASQWDSQLNCITFAWNCVLEHLKNIRPFDKEAKFPLRFVPGLTERRDKNRHYGLTRRMMDPQREVNKRRSKLLFRTSAVQTRYVEGAFEDDDLARRELQKPDCFLKQRQGYEVIVDKGLDIAPAEFQLLQQATKEIDEAAGGKELEGRSGASSGREFQLRLQQAAAPLREMLGNLRKARRQIAEYHGEEIIEEMNAAGEKDAEGNPVIPLQKYDYLVEEAPESLNLNGETFEQMVALATAVPSIGQQMPLDMILKVAPLAANVKSEFLSRLKQQQDQQAQQAMMQQQMMQQMAAQQGGGQAPPGA